MTSGTIPNTQVQDITGNGGTIGVEIQFGKIFKFAHLLIREPGDRIIYFPYNLFTCQ